MCGGRSRANCRVMTVLWTTECRSTRPLERRFVDLSGKMPSSAGWAQYRTMTGDKFSPMGWPYFVKRKSDAKMAFARFLTDINAPGVLSTVEFLLSDNGTVFTKPELVETLNPPCIRREYTNVASPEHDGLLERRISMMLELAMVSRLVDTRLFDESKMLLTGFLLAEACKYACDVLNTTAGVMDKADMYSPYQKCFPRAPFARLLGRGFHHVNKARVRSVDFGRECSHATTSELPKSAWCDSTIEPQSLRLEASAEIMAQPFGHSQEALLFEQNPADACHVFNFKSGSISIATVVHAGDRPEPPCLDHEPVRVAVVCWLSRFKGLGCWSFRDFAASLR